MSQMRRFLIIATLLLSACVSQPQPGVLGDPDNFDPVEAAKTRISLGLTYLKNGNYSQAKFNLDKALQFAPRYADAHYSIAYYYQVVGENTLAEQAYQKAMDYAPRNPDIANTYGAFLCQQGKYEQAKSYFLKAVNSANYVSTAETYENLALCSQSQGQVNDAITYLQNALNHQPSRSRSLLMLAQLYAADEQWEASRETLRRYEKMARVSPETLWLSVKIEQALGNEQVAQGYGDMLIRMYPGHPNTIDYIEKRNRATEPNIQVAVSRPKPVISTPAPQSVPTETGTDIVEAQAPVVEEVEAPAPPAEVTEAPSDTAALVQNQVEDAEPADVAPPEQDVENTLEDETLAAVSEQNVPAQHAEPATTEIAEQAVEQVENTSEPQSQLEVPAEETSEGLVAQVEEVVSNDPVEDPQQDSGEIAEEGAELAVPTHHVVKKNENLYRISLQYNIKMQRLIEWNQLEDASSIYVGKKLLVVDPQTLE